MNDLTLTYATIAQQSDTVSNAKQIYAICRTITPAFYKKQTAQEMELDVASISLLIQGIRPDILSMMCKLAVMNYGKARAKDSRVFFGINYILTFYKDAWEKARPANMSWILKVSKETGQWVITYCDVDDLDENGNLKPGAPVWLDESINDFAPSAPSAPYL